MTPRRLRDNPASDPVVADAVARALAEDLLADGDITTALVPKARRRMSPCEPARPACWPGRACVTETFRQLDPDLALIWYLGDGSVLVPGQTIMEVTGPLRPILTAERTALNFLGRLSGVATLTAQLRGGGTRPQSGGESARYAQDHSGTSRPREGGGPSRRRRQPPVEPLRGRVGQGQPPGRRHHHRSGRTGAGDVAGPLVQIECDTLDQVVEAARAGSDAVLLDNMDPATVAEAIEVAHAESDGPILTEVSGGVTLQSIGDYAAVGPDWISVGALTHSATVLDLGLDLIWRHTEGD